MSRGEVYNMSWEGGGGGGGGGRYKSCPGV